MFDHTLTLGHECINFDTGKLAFLFNIQYSFYRNESYPKIEDDHNVDLDA